MLFGGGSTTKLAAQIHGTRAFPGETESVTQKQDKKRPLYFINVCSTTSYKACCGHPESIFQGEGPPQKSLADEQIASETLGVTARKTGMFQAAIQ